MPKLRTTADPSDPPSSSTSDVTVQIPTEFLKRADMYAATKGLSFPRLIVQALTLFLVAIQSGEVDSIESAPTEGRQRVSWRVPAPMHRAATATARYFEVANSDVYYAALDRMVPETDSREQLDQALVSAINFAADLDHDLSTDTT